MPLKITLVNSTRIPFRGKQLICDSIERALKAQKVRHGRVDVILVNDSVIKKLHKQWFNDGSVTDVITFPIEEKPPILAEIYINIQQAKRQAAEYAVSTQNELCRLGVHGALHIAGYEDETDEKREQMRKLENRYI